MPSRPPAARGEVKGGGVMLALAYPDRIAKSRGGGSGAFLLANGRGGAVDPASALAREPFLAVAELTGAAGASRIVLGGADHARRNRGALRRQDRGPRGGDVSMPRSASLRARRSRRLGALVLAEQTKPVAPDAETARILAQGIVGLGLDRLPWSKAALQLRNRVHVPAPGGRRRMAGPVQRRSRAQRGRLAGAVAARQDRAQRYLCR